MKTKIAVSEAFQFADREKILRATSEIDEEWYKDRYPDVRRLGISPRDHFIRYGEKLRRAPGPGFDTAFYLDTYRLWHPSGSPLADYLTAKELYRRPTTPAQLRDQWESLGHKTQEAWGAEGHRKISYCTPIMNRFDDIHGTLKWNLDSNRAFEKDIEFIVIEFGNSTDVVDWITSDPDFQRDLESGYLRVIADRETLDTWHFGRAKNAFKGIMRGQIYSSLDGDNFVTSDETEWLLKVANENKCGFVAHHSSGNFSDGSCGRISMPARVYRAAGYNGRFLPREFDDIDLMIGALKTCPAAPLVTVPPPNIERLPSFGEFVEQERMPNRILHKSYPSRKSPLNPQKPGHGKRNPHLVHLSRFNAAISGLQWSVSKDRRKQYLQIGKLERHALLAAMPTKDLVEALFECSCELPRLTDDDLPLFACMKDEEQFLPAFLSHYRGLGVTHFFLVDDGSEIPLSEMDLGQDVIVLRTKSATFEVAKALWVQTIAQAVTLEGAWILTVDADEFLQLPEPFTSLRELVEQLDSNRSELVSGLILDMIPSSPSIDIENPVQSLEAFDSFCWRTDSPSPEYSKQGTVLWAFRRQIEMSWRVDIRFHAFGTIDSMRKIPLVRLRRGYFLNQGFHAIHDVTGVDHEVMKSRAFERDIILPIFHYKLTKLWDTGLQQQMLEKSASYDLPTAQNIQQIFRQSDQKQALSKLKPWLMPAEAARTLDFRKNDPLPTVDRTERRVAADAKGQGPILILALQRTGSTTLASRLFENSRFESAPDHEPFLRKRVYGRLLRDFETLSSTGQLEFKLSEVLARQECIKHCFDVVRFDFTRALVTSALQANYRIVFLYRNNLLNRLASTAFAQTFRIWEPAAARQLDVEELEAAGRINARKLLQDEAIIIERMNALWNNLVVNGAQPISVSFEELFEEDEQTAMQAIDRLFDHLSLSDDFEVRRKFLQALRAKGEQGTRSQYAHMEGYELLAEGVEKLPKIQLGS